MPVAAAILHVFVDNVTIQTCNAIFAERFQAKSQEWIGGKGDPDGCHQNIVRFAHSSSTSEKFERCSDHPLGTEFLNCALGRLSDHPDGIRRLLLTMIDRTSERQTETKRRRELVSDSLTGLPNPPVFVEDVVERRADAER